MAVRRPAPSPQKTVTARINRRITAPSVRLVGDTIEILPTRVALERAIQAGLDLVEVAAGEIPVCKLMNYSRYKYEEDQKRSENQKKSKAAPTKEIQIRPGIAEGDYQVKLKNALGFLNNGNPIVLIMQFRGRELMVQQDVGRAVLERFCKDTSEVGKISGTPNLEGRRLQVSLISTKSKKEVSKTE